MPATVRILEILFYSMFAFIPWLMLAFYPFRSRLRFSGELIAIPAAILAAAQISADITIGFGLADNALLIRLILIVINVGLCFAAIRAPLTEIAVNTLMVLVLALVSSFAAKGLTAVIAAASPYGWIHTLILLLLECLLIALYFPIRKAADKLLNHAEAAPSEAAPEAAEPEEEVPAEEAAEEIPAAPAAEEPEAKSATRKLPRLHFSQKSAADSPKRLQTVQYDNLISRIDQSRQMNHELDLQTKSMLIHLNNKDYDKLRASLAAVQEQFPTESDVVCCEHVDLNATLVYFLRQAERRGIRMTADVQCPGNIHIDPRDLIVLIGNLLDNALEACKSQNTADRRITVSGRPEGQRLCFVVENTYQKPVQQDRHGNYLSAKYDSCPGTGLEVVRSIAERYNGAVKIDHTNGIFQVSVTLSI